MYSKLLTLINLVTDFPLVVLIQRVVTVVIMERNLRHHVVVPMLVHQLVFHEYYRHLVWKHYLKQWDVDVVRGKRYHKVYPHDVQDHFDDNNRQHHRQNHHSQIFMFEDYHGQTLMYRLFLGMYKKSIVFIIYY